MRTGRTQTEHESHNIRVVRAFMTERVELVSAFGDDRSACRIESALAAVAHPEFELIDRDSLEFAGRAISVDGYVAAWRHFLECWERLYLVAEDIVEHKDRLVVIARVSGESKNAGILLEDRRAAISTFRKGRVLRIEQFTTPAEALVAAGLPAEREASAPLCSSGPSWIPSVWTATADNASAA
jgi:ketosteroid isomerase-like protein